MRVRIRGPGGQSTVTLPDDATVADLKAEITKSTSIADFDVKSGYPPCVLRLQDYESIAKLSSLDLKLNGEQLIVSERLAPSSATSQPSPDKPTTNPKVPELQRQKLAMGQSTARMSSAPLSLSRKAPSSDAPEVAIPSHAATMVLRIMPDDNSCLFRAFNSAYFGAMDNMHELRSVIAQTIQDNKEKYSAVVLEREPDDYCRWIQTSDAWGGAIELDILSRHFDVEICSVDVQSLRVDRFNEGQPKRCVLVYSGIHYDVIALSPSDPPYDKAYAPPDFDEKVFNADDPEILETAVQLCKVLQQQHYFTDTATFSIRCNTCGSVFMGERGATEHASITGHYDFGEAE